MIVLHNDLEQQLTLSVKDERWDDHIRFRDVIRAPVNDGQGQIQTTNRLYLQLKMEPGLQTSKKEKTENEVAHKRCKGESPGLRITHGPTLTISTDPIRATHNRLEATTSLDTTMQDTVGIVVPDNMDNGETSGHNYDVIDEMNNETDKFEAQFTDRDTRDGWRIFDQLSVWGDGTGGGDTWDPGAPTLFASSKDFHTVLHVISFQNALL